MEAKKNPKLAIEPKQKMYAMLGLCISLSFVIVAFEWKSTEPHIVDMGTIDDEIEVFTVIQQTRFETPEPPKPKIKDPIVIAVS